jgi:phenylacetic acid degradation protein
LPPAKPSAIIAPRNAGKEIHMTRVYAIDGVIPVIDPAAFVHPTAVLTGDVIVEAGCYVGPCASLRGDFGRLILRRGANIQDNCTMHGFPASDTVIGEDGHIGHGAILHGCTVERNALVGMNAVVMDGAVIGESAFVAAMAFVRAGFVVPPRSLVAGLPAKLLRPLTEAELAWKISATAEYHELTRRSLASLVEVAPLSAIEPGRKRVEGGAALPLHQQKRDGEPA